MSYRPIFSDSAVAFFAGLTRRNQQRFLDRARELAADPFVVPDLHRTDAEGREICDLLIDDLLFTYWVDHASKQILIIEVEDAT